MGEGAVKETILPNFNDSFLPAQNMWIVFFKSCFILIALIWKIAAHGGNVTKKII